MVDERNANDTKAFLELWFAGCPNGQRLEIRPFREKRPQQQQWCPNVETALAHIERSVANGDDVYIGALPRAKFAGSTDAVGARVWLWADIDVGALGHKRLGRYESFETALEALEKCGFEPTMVVHSGGGLHAWWRLESVPTPEQWSDAIVRIVHKVGGDLAVCDAPRILRVPGTLNHKTKPPRPVRLLACSGKLTRIEDVLALPAPPVPTKSVTRAPSAGQPSGDRPFDRANDIPVADVLAWLGIPMHSEGARIYCACPVHRGSNVSQMVVGGERNVATCFGDCAGRHFSAVDIVQAVRKCSAREAVAALALRFGFDAWSTPAPAAPTAGSVAWEDSLLRTGRGIIKTSVGNVLLILRNDPDFKGKIRFNEMTQSPELDGVRLQQADVTRLRGFLEEKYKMFPSAQTTWEALNAVADESSYHPVRVYLKSLQWDGVVRLRNVVTEVLGAIDTPLNHRLLRAWFVAAVARAMQPGSKVDTALVLVGPQGYGKSSFFRALGEPWFSDTAIDIERKDAYLQLAGAWIYECQEVEHVAAREMRSQVKAFMSSQTDTFRKPYEHATAQLKRWCVLVGTTNEEQFLADPTGARRYWPLRVTHLVDIQKLKTWRDQLWAEAVAAYESRESWWLSASDEAALAEAAEQFRSTDPWEEAVTTYIASVRPDAQHSTRSILSGIRIPDHLQNKQAANRISLIMQKLGYRTARTRDGEGHAPRVWKKEQSA